MAVVLSKDCFNVSRVRQAECLYSVWVRLEDARCASARKAGLRRGACAGGMAPRRGRAADVAECCGGTSPSQDGDCGKRVRLKWVRRRLGATRVLLLIGEVAHHLIGLRERAVRKACAGTPGRACV